MYYIFAYANMHQAKLYAAYEKCLSPNEYVPKGESIQIIDWECCQAIGTITFIDYLKEYTNFRCTISKVTLIGPSLSALKRAAFCRGDKDEFSKWKKGLSDLSKQSTRAKAEKTLKVEIDEEAFDRLYDCISHPIIIKKKGQKIAVRVISQFVEESTKV